MPSPGSERGLGPLAAALAMTVAAAVGCGAPQRPAVASHPAAMPLPAPREGARPAAVVDTRGCDPSGKSIVVVARDAGGRPSRWRYFAAAHRQHRTRVLTCEAADRNGDGKIDTRYFYGASGRLVLEQRDMDFDGQAEFVADYSQFPTRAPLVRARDVN